MRELVLNKWCDICYLEEEAKVPATLTLTAGMVVGENRPELKLVELCERHSKPFTDLQALLAQIGQTPDVPAKVAPVKQEGSYAQRLMVCPICRAEYARNGMVSHVWRAHRTDKRPETKGRCPTCREQFDNGAGLAAHRRIAHGYDALQDALSGVKGYQP